MATGKVIGKIEVASIGSVKIVGADGVMRDAAYEGLMYEGEQFVSNNPETLFQVRYLALPEATVYEGVFGVLADGSVIADVSELETLFGDDIDFMETAAGGREDDSNSGIPEDAGIVAESKVQDFQRGGNPEPTGLDGVGVKGAENGNYQPVVEDVEMSVYESADPDYDNNTGDDVYTILTGTLVAADDNLGDSHMFYTQNVSVASSDVDSSLLPISSVVLTNNAHGDATPNSAVFTIEGNFNALAAGETATVTFEYYAVDDSGFKIEPNDSEVKTVTITVIGTNDQPVVSDVTPDVVDIGAVMLNGDTTTGVDYWNFTHTGGDLTVDMLTEMNNNGNPLVQDGSGVYNDINGDGQQTSLDVMIRVYALNPDGTRGIQVGVNDDNNNLGEDGSFWNRDSYLSLDDLPPGEYQLVVGAWNLTPAEVDSGVNAVDHTGWYYEGPYQISLKAEDGVQMGNKVVMFEAENGNTIIESDLPDVYDVDASDTHIYSLVGDSVTISDSSITSFSVTVNPEGSYVLDGDFNSLAVGERATVTFDYVADDQHGFDGTDGTHESSISEPATVTMVIVGTNDAPTLIVTDDVNFNETTTGEVLVGNAVGDDVDNGAILTYSLDNHNDIFEIDANSGAIIIKDGVSLDYELAPSYNLDVRVTDEHGASDMKTLEVNVNDVTGTMLYTSADIMQTFDGVNSEGWSGLGSEHYSTSGILGWFDKDSDTRSQTFDLSDSAGESANISFDLGTYGFAEGYSWVSTGWLSGYFEPYGQGWEGNDTFRVRITDSDGNPIETENFSPNGNHTPAGGNMISLDLDITVPQDGEITVSFKSVHTDDYGVGLEAWSIDNFKIDGESREVLSFENSADGTIDVEALVDQANDFEDAGGTSIANPDSLDTIDLSIGNHDLSNITLADVLDMTDGDNVLKITGDSGDSVNDIASNGWIDSAAQVTDATTTYDVYTHPGDSSAQLLIDIDIPIDVV